MQEKYYRNLFSAGAILKALDGLLQLAAALALLLVHPDTITRIIIKLVGDELTESPPDFFAPYLRDITHITASSQHFGMLLLSVHGIINLSLAIGLLKKWLWAYPTAIVLFSGFVIYQVYRFFHTHSVGLLVLSGLDCIIIALTIHEYILARKKNIEV